MVTLSNIKNDIKEVYKMGLLTNMIKLTEKEHLTNISLWCAFICLEVRFEIQQSL